MGIISKFIERREMQRVEQFERSIKVGLEYMRYCESCRMEMKTPVTFKIWYADNSPDREGSNV